MAVLKKKKGASRTSRRNAVNTNLPRLIVASSNKNKLRELNDLLGSRFKLVSMREAGITYEIEENGKTFEENALIKAHTVARITGESSIADDSGLEVDALGGAPGIFSARYSGGHGNDYTNNELLLQKLHDVPSPRTARYVAAIALVRPGHADIVRRGTCKGEILTDLRGSGGFGYDPLFQCETGETFAEISPQRKNAISHRRRALEAVLKALEEEEP